VAAFQALVTNPLSALPSSRSSPHEHGSNNATENKFRWEAASQERVHITAGTRGISSWGEPSWAPAHALEIITTSEGVSRVSLDRKAPAGRAKKDIRSCVRATNRYSPPWHARNILVHSPRCAVVLVARFLSHDTIAVRPGLCREQCGRTVRFSSREMLGCSVSPDPDEPTSFYETSVFRRDVSHQEHLLAQVYQSSSPPVAKFA
jgi:hypothetical protein